MNVLLKPGVNLIGRFTFARKFQILSVVFLAPVAYAAFALCASYLERLEAVERERQGVAILLLLDPARQVGIRQRNEASHWKVSDISSVSSASGETSMLSWLESQKQFELGLVGNAPVLLSYVHYAQLVEAVIANQARLRSAISNPQALASWWTDAYNISLNQSQALGGLSSLIIREHKLNLDPWPDTSGLTALATGSLPELLEIVSSLGSTGQGIIASNGFTLLSRAQLRDTSARSQALVSKLGQQDFAVGDSEDLGRWLSEYKAGILKISGELANVEEDFFKAKTIPRDRLAFANKMLKLQKDIGDLQRSALISLDLRLGAYQEKAKLSFLLTLAAFSALVGLAIYILLCVQFAIRRSTVGVTSLADSLREGDLRVAVELHGRDELADIGFSLNSAVRQLRNSFIRINDRTGELNVTVAGLARQSDTSFEAVQSQQTQVSSIASAAAEMAATASDVARNCELASQHAREADTLAKKGAEQSRTTITSIKGLTACLDDVVADLKALQKQTSEIESVVTVIKKIADQTNLLALNAAIEAARAGEHGRGFAVVADEVRGLSTRTKESTQVISDTVFALQKVVQSSVVGMQMACSRAREDESSVIGLNEQLETISVVVGQVTEMIYQIAAAAEQQAMTADEVSGNIQQINDMTKVLSDSAEQVKAGTEQLDSGSKQLSGYTAAFKL